jgi:predicted cupin superfamily sugar epimerase
MNAETIIRRLDLKPHPEGGFYRETYRSGQLASFPGFAGSRSICTSIFFLLRGNDFSTFHRIRQDEIWHFYAGSALTLHLFEHGPAPYRSLRLGNNLANRETPLAVVSAGSTQAAETTGEWTLAGCTVAPGFDFSDFTIADKAELLADFPNFAPIILRLAH